MAIKVESGGNFPSDNVTESEKKSKDWILQAIRAAYKSASYGRYSTYEERKSKWISLRREADGSINLDQIKLGIFNDGSTAPLNLSLDESTPLPTIRENVVGALVSQDVSPDIKPLNPESRLKIDRKRQELLNNMLLWKRKDEILETTGIDITTKIKSSDVFESEEEIELYMSTTYKVAESISLESGLDWVESLNDSKQLNRKIIRDLTDIGIGCEKVFMDTNGKISYQYVDPVKLITPFVENEDYSDSKYRGYVEDMTIDKLAKLSNLSGEQLRNAAKTAVSESKWQKTWNQYYAYTNASGAPYGNFKVSVVHMEYMSHDKYKYEMIPKRGGGFRFQKIKTNPKNKKNKVKEVWVENIYEGSWVVNSDVLYNYGLQKNMYRESTDSLVDVHTKFKLDIYSPDILDMMNRSLVEKMSSVSKAYLISKLKMQQLIAKMRPNGVAIDISGVAGAVMGMGVKNLKPKDLENRFNETGNYYYSSVREDGSYINNPNIIREIPESQMTALNQLRQQVMFHLEELTLVSGIPLSNIGAPDANALVGIEKLKTINRNNSLKSLNMAYHSILKSRYEKVCYYLKELVSNGEGLDTLRMAIGYNKAEQLTLKKDISSVMVGIDVKIGMDAEELASIYEEIKVAMANQLLKPSDSFFIRKIATKDPEEAMAYMRLKEKKYAEEKRKLNIEATQAQAQAQGQMDLQSKQAEAQNMQLKYDLELRNMKEKYKLEASKSTQDSMEKMNEDDNASENKQQEIKVATESAGQSLENSSIPRGLGVTQPKVMPQT